MNKKMDIRNKVRKNILENVEKKASLDYMFLQNISQIKEQADTKNKKLFYLLKNLYKPQIYLKTKHEKR